MHLPIEEGVGVDGDTIGVAQDRVVHHVDPGVNGRNGAFVPNHIVEISTNVPNLLHDVLGSICDFVSDRQAINVASAVFLHGIDEYANVLVDLNGIMKNLEFSSIWGSDFRLTREAELAMVPSGFLGQENGSLEIDEDEHTNPDTDKNRQSILFGGSGGQIKSSTYAQRIWPSSRGGGEMVRTTIISINPESLVPVVLGVGDDGIPLG